MTVPWNSTVPKNFCEFNVNIYLILLNFLLFDCLFLYFCLKFLCFFNFFLLQQQPQQVLLNEA